MVKKEEVSRIERRYAVWACPTHATGLRWKDTDGNWKTPKEGCGRHQVMLRDFCAERGLIVDTQGKCNDKDCSKRPRINEGHVLHNFPHTRAGKELAKEAAVRLNQETNYVEWF